MPTIRLLELTNFATLSPTKQFLGGLLTAEVRPRGCRESSPDRDPLQAVQHAFAAAASKNRHMELIKTRQTMRAATAHARQEGKTIGVVPTMGALHEGHLSLVAACCRECDFRVVTIYVNPTQFGPDEDLQKYPRTLAADLKALESFDVDVVFAPSSDEMYRSGYSTYVEVEGLTDAWEGACRPGHFRGVTTIVAKLFNAVGPDVAYFGQKDYQQSLVVRRMVDDLDWPIEIRVCPIVREPDGLALSSRNVFLLPEVRKQALVLSKSLELAAEMASAGERDAAIIRRRMLEQFDRQPHVRVQYVAIVHPETMEPIEHLDADAVIAVAAFAGETRLIDNRRITPPDRK